MIGNTLIDGNLVTRNSNNIFGTATATTAFGFFICNALGAPSGQYFTVQNNGLYYFGAPYFRTYFTGNPPPQFLYFKGAYAGSILTRGGINFSTYSGSYTQTSGFVNFFKLQVGYTIASGAVIANGLLVGGTISQVGAIKGKTRGIYINSIFPNPPANYRALETLVNTESGRTRYQWACIGAGRIYVAYTDPTTGVQLGETNFIFDTVIGTKIGSATNQRFSFWNVPVSVGQPTTAITAPAYVVVAGGTAVTINDTFDGYTLGKMVKALRNMGLLA